MPAACLPEYRFSMPPIDFLVQPSSSDPGVAELYREVRRSTRDSITRTFTWRKLGALTRRFDVIEQLEPNWDGDEAAAPNDLAKLRARRILALLDEVQLEPTAIMPSVEGGIGITFVYGRRRGSIELLNSGEMVAAYYEGLGEPQVWEFNGDNTSISESVEKIRVYLSA